MSSSLDVRSVAPVSDPSDPHNWTVADVGARVECDPGLAAYLVLCRQCGTERVLTVRPSSPRSVAEFVLALRRLPGISPRCSVQLAHQVMES